MVDGLCSSRWILLQDRKDSSLGHFGRFWPILDNFVADKPFSDLNTNLKPQKSSVEFISEKWKSLELANSLLLHLMWRDIGNYETIFCQFLGHFGHFLARKIIE